MWACEVGDGVVERNKILEYLHVWGWDCIKKHIRESRFMNSYSHHGNFGRKLTIKDFQLTEILTLRTIK